MTSVSCRGNLRRSMRRSAPERSRLWISGFARLSAKLEYEGTMYAGKGSRGNEPASDGVTGELDAVAHAELLEDVRAVPFHGLFRDVQKLGDLVVGMGFGDEFED